VEESVSLVTDHIIMRMMKKSRSQRFQSPQELRHAIEEALLGGVSSEVCEFDDLAPLPGAAADESEEIPTVAPLVSKPVPVLKGKPRVLRKKGAFTGRNRRRRRR
jgi:hypothetical protein